jgi:hypothetical protein
MQTTRVIVESSLTEFAMNAKLSKTPPPVQAESTIQGYVESPDLQETYPLQVLLKCHCKRIAIVVGNRVLFVFVIIEVLLGVLVGILGAAG